MLCAQGAVARLYEEWTWARELEEAALLSQPQAHSGPMKASYALRGSCEEAQGYHMMLSLVRQSLAGDAENHPNLLLESVCLLET